MHLLMGNTSCFDLRSTKWDATYDLALQQRLGTCVARDMMCYCVCHGTDGISTLHVCCKDCVKNQPIIKMDKGGGVIVSVQACRMRQGGDHAKQTHSDHASYYNIRTGEIVWQRDKDEPTNPHNNCWKAVLTHAGLAAANALKHPYFEVLSNQPGALKRVSYLVKYQAKNKGSGQEQLQHWKNELLRIQDGAKKVLLRINRLDGECEGTRPSDIYDKTKCILYNHDDMKLELELLVLLETLWHFLKLKD